MLVCQWGDLRADGGGLVAVHAAARTEVGVALAFEHPDVRALQQQLTGADEQSWVLDENHGFSLRLPDPDARQDGNQLWVNETQRDLHGYRVLPS